MKPLHTIKPPIEEELLQAAWTVHHILKGYTDEIIDHEFSRGPFGALLYRRPGRNSRRWSTLSSEDVRSLNRRDTVQRHGPYPPHMSEHFVENSA